MLKNWVLILALFSIGLSPLHAQQPGTSAFIEKPELTKAIDEVLHAAIALKSGMTRADVLRNFTIEGGPSTRSQRRYVYRGCPYIKIDVTFDVLPSSGEDELPGDRIVSVSKPYLEYSIMD